MLIIKHTYAAECTSLCDSRRINHQPCCSLETLLFEADNMISRNLLIDSSCSATTFLHLSRFFNISSKDKSIYFNSDILSYPHHLLALKLYTGFTISIILTVSSTLFKIASIGLYAIGDSSIVL